MVRNIDWYRNVSSSRRKVIGDIAAQNDAMYEACEWYSLVYVPLSGLAQLSGISGFQSVRNLHHFFPNVLVKNGFCCRICTDPERNFWYLVVENTDVSETATQNLFHEENSNDKEEDDDEDDSADDSSSSDDDSWPKVAWINCFSYNTACMKQLQLLLLC